MTITSLQAISCLGDLFSRFRKMSFLFSSPRRTPESTEKIELVRGLPILWSLTTSWCTTPYQEIKRFYKIHVAYNNKLNSTKLHASFKFKIKQEQENYTTNRDRAEKWRISMQTAKQFHELTCLSSFVFFLGALTHYFCLAHSFWSMCFVANTYAVVVHHNRAVFKHPIKIHLMQSVLGWLVPAVVVASCLYFCQPGYKFYFMDLMSAGPASSEMAYFAISLPLTVTLGVSLCLLWSIVWHIRKVRA